MSEVKVNLVSMIMYCFYLMSYPEKRACFYQKIYPHTFYSVESIGDYGFPSMGLAHGS